MSDITYSLAMWAAVGMHAVYALTDAPPFESALLFIVTMITIIGAQIGHDLSEA